MVSATLLRDITAQTPKQSLFDCAPEDRLMLSVHLLGKPTSAQLYRLHQDHFTTLQNVQAMTARLSRKPDPKLAVVRPLDITNISLKLPYVFLDTWASRRHVEKTFGIPFRRPPELPSRNWDFIRHDVDLAEGVISVELTARKHQVPFGYQNHYDGEGAPLFPLVTIEARALTHKLRPIPDKTLIVGDYHLVREHDCGNETVELSNIIRDATIGRKHLVYDQLERMGTLDKLGWGRRLLTFTIDSRKRTQKAARKRVKRCVDTFPEWLDPKRTFFVDWYSYQEAGDDISQLEWVRADGRVQTLPCW